MVLMFSCTAEKASIVVVIIDDLQEKAHEARNEPNKY